MFEEMLVAIGDSLSDLVNSDDGENGENEDDQETEQGKLREYDKRGWVMGTITKTVQQHIERFRQKHMKVDELTHPGWDNATNSFCVGDKKYGTSELMVPAVIQQQTNDDTSPYPPKPFGDLIESP
jgi:hypothetical protein